MTTPTYAVRGRAGRGRSWGPVHALPATDTTRSALCGAPVQGARRALDDLEGRPFPSSAAHAVITCPECAAARSEVVPA